MRPHCIHGSWVALSVALMASSAQAALPTYRVQVIGEPGTFGEALNDLGEVAGGFYPQGSWPPQAFVYRGGSLQAVEPLSGRESGALAINERGDVAGAFVADSGLGQPYLYRNGQLTNPAASLPGMGSGAVRAINAVGQAVGHFSEKAFFYDGHTSRFLFETQGWPRQSASAADLNDHGDIVGALIDYEGDTLTSRAFFYGRDGRLGWMQGLGGRIDNVYAVNNLGQAVGFSRLADQDFDVPVIYENGRARSLGSAQDPYGQAMDINDKGWIVGDSRSRERGASGFLYADGQLHSMDTLLSVQAARQWHVTEGVAINNRDQILAWGVVGSGTSTQRSTLLLTPVPEPASLALMLAGVGLIGAVVRRNVAPVGRRRPLGRPTHDGISGHSRSHRG